MLRALPALAILMMTAACQGGDEGSPTGNSGSDGGGGGGQTPVDSADLTIIEGNGVSIERIVALARNNPQASADAIRAVEELAEYARNPAMVASGLANKIALGLTGAGVRVGVVDSGIDWSNSNLQGVVRGGDLIDLAGGYPNDAQTEGGLRHGTAVAQIIAGTPDDGNYARGIAPGVTLHNLAFMSEKTEDAVYFGSDTIGRIMDYSRANQLDIVNMSFSLAYDQTLYTTRSAAERLVSPTLRTQIERAVAGGSIFVIATGNDGLAESSNSLIGLGQIDGLMNGQLIAVTALNEAGTALADFSNACGTAMNYCISAVGVRVPVVNSNGTIVGFSGTSSAAPVVSGSMALLLEQFPELGAAEAVELIFATADDLGATGIDAVYGRGALNMNRAVAPVGELVVATGTSTLQTMSIADALVETNGVTAGLASSLKAASISVIDDFDRGFAVGADNFLTFRDDPVSPVREFVLDLELTGLARMRIDGDGGILFSGERLSFGHVSPEAVFGTGLNILDQGYSPAHVMDRSLAVGYRFGKTDLLFAGSDGGDNAMIQIGRTLELGATELRGSLGVVYEDHAMLGTDLDAGHSVTAWAGLYAQHEFASGISLFGDLTLANTEMKNGSFIFESADLRSSSARVGLLAPIGRGIAGISVGTPLVAHSGTITSDVPTGRDEATDGETSTGVERTRITSNITSGHPVDLGLSWTSPVGKGSALTISAARRFDDRDGIDRQDDWFGVQFRARF